MNAKRGVDQKHQGLWKCQVHLTLGNRYFQQGFLHFRVWWWQNKPEIDEDDATTLYDDSMNNTTYIKIIYIRVYCYWPGSGI